MGGAASVIKEYDEKDIDEIRKILYEERGDEENLLSETKDRIQRVRQFLRTRVVKEGDEEQTQEVVKEIRSAFTKIHDESENIWDTYEKKETVGFGLCGAVFVVKEKSTGQKFAMKSVLKKHLKLLSDFRSEIKLLTTLDHPNVIKLYEAWETKKRIFIILEYCDGGDLFDSLAENDSYSEQDAAHIFRQMLRAIHYCHEHAGITHRDIKLENFLFCNRNSSSHCNDPQDQVLKLIDFGLSKRFVGNGIARMRSTVGTSYYVAPEVLRKRPYTNKCDMWSLGVVLFMLLSGKSPFLADSEAEILNAAIKADVQFVDEDWVGVSESAKNLVCSLLVLDPKKRPTASEALKHPWLRNSASPFPLKPKSVIYDSLKEFSSFSELKKVVIDMIAFSMSTKDLEDSTLWFRVIDKDNSGSISLQEFRQALKGKGINEDMISNVFEKIDQDHNGTITFSEFLAATLDKTKYLEDCRLTAVFKKLDTDHDGKISLSDLTDALGEWYSVSEIEKMIHDVQSKSGGDSSSSTVNFHQFVEAMYDGTGDYMRPYKTRALSMCVPTT